MKLKFKKWQLVTGTTLLIMILLNPSYSDFREYTGQEKNDGYYTIQKEWNFLACSIYTTSDNESHVQHEYLAILKNFIEIRVVY